MSQLRKHAATAIGLLIFGVAVILLFMGQFFHAGFLLTLLAFVIYFRAVSS